MSNKVILTDKSTGNKACIEMADADTIKISYSDGREAYHKKTGELVSYSNGKQDPKMKCLQKKKIFRKEWFIFGAIIGAIILFIILALSSLDGTEKSQIDTHEAYYIMRNEVNPAPAYDDIIFIKTENGYQLNTKDGFAVSVHYDYQSKKWTVYNYH